MELEHEVASDEALCGTARSRSLSDGCLHLSSCKLHEADDVMSESTECDGTDPLSTFDSLDTDEEALLTFPSMKSENEIDDVEVCSVCSLDDEDEDVRVSPVTPGPSAYAMFQYVPCCMTMVPVTNSGSPEDVAQRPSRSSRRRRARATKRIQGSSEWSAQAQLLLQQTERQPFDARSVAQASVQPQSGIAWPANTQDHQRWADLTEVEPKLAQTQRAGVESCDENFNQLKRQLDDLVGKWCSHSDHAISGRFSCHTVAGHVKIPVHMQVGC